MFERIDPKMLCQGHWILATEKNLAVQVSEIHEDGIVATDRNTYLFDELVGIELTEDWFHAANFLPADDGTFRLEGFPFQLIPHQYIMIEFYGREVAGVRFVHELQLFYSGIKQRQLVIAHSPGL